MSDKEVLIDYTNWKGERKIRKIHPTGRMQYMSTKWHPEEQWLLEARDLEGGDVLKWFAMKDIHAWVP